MNTPLTSAVKEQTVYSAYGLRIESQIPLHGFATDTSAGRSDVSVRITEENDDWISRVEHQDHAVEIDQSEGRFWFKDVGALMVRRGTEITISPRRNSAEQPDDTLLRLYVEGMMMAMLLHQRGMCVLHASVIEVHGAAIAFLGHIGAGKSSTAAAFYSRGYRILTDDNAAIQLDSGLPMVAPGYPYIKLFPSIAESLGFKSSELALLHETQSKMAGAVSRNFSTRALRLRTIYVLGRDHAPEITRLSPLNATIELIRNAIPTRWGHPGDDRQLQQCAAIANQIPVFAIRTFRELADLPELVDRLQVHQSVDSAPGQNAGAARQCASWRTGVPADGCEATHHGRTT